MATPATYAGLEWWVKGDTGRWQDTAGTIAATAASDPIGRWDDQSGNGRNATQATAGLRPTVASAVLNSVDGVLFTGASSQFLSLPNFLTGFTSGHLFVVVKIANQPPVAAKSGAWTFGSYTNADYYSSTDSQVYSSFGSTTRQNALPVQNLASAYRTFEVVSVAGRFEMWMDGDSFYRNTSNVVGWTTAPYVGKNAPGYFLDGTIVEMFLYSQERAIADRIGIQDYLNTRFGLFVIGDGRVTQEPIIAVQAPLGSGRATQEPIIAIRSPIGTARTTQEPLISVQERKGTGALTQEAMVVVRQVVSLGAITQGPIIIVRQRSASRTRTSIPGFMA